nr:Cytidine and deoxycytidylate deaminase zinc-binding region [uncultured bacterium]AIA15311.1 Cytidine and deoxycytidylate deaminase zinc-binding region [uncultured bacterium]
MKGIKKMKTEYQLDWAGLAFSSKKPVQELRATFIAAPREISPKRFTQLIKTYSPKGNIVLGIAKESYVQGLENQPAFRMLEPAMVDSIIKKVNAANSKHKIYTLAYFQRELPYVLEKLKFTRAIFVNGSWYHAFHLRPEFYVLASQHIPYELVSPFTDEVEAKAYEKEHIPPAPKLPTQPITEREMIALAAAAATQSFAYSEHQTGVSLGKRAGMKYRALACSFNRVVPYQTYAMHFGASRERNFSPMNDLNHYDPNHAEVELLTTALKQKLDLRGTTLFINLLPCPTCARMLTATDIEEFVYREDHSDGYAVKLLQEAGKQVRRVV